MRCAGRDEQTIACLQSQRSFTVFLPNACSRNDIESYRRRMKMTRVDSSWRVLRVPHNNFPPGRPRNIALEQAFVGDAYLAMSGIRHIQIRRTACVLPRSGWISSGETWNRNGRDDHETNRCPACHEIFPRCPPNYLSLRTYRFESTLNTIRDSWCAVRRSAADINAALGYDYPGYDKPYAAKVLGSSAST